MLLKFACRFWLFCLQILQRVQQEKRFSSHQNEQILLSDCDQRAQHVSRQILYSSCLLRMQPDTHPALPKVGNTGSTSVSLPVLTSHVGPSTKHFLHFYHQCLIQLISQFRICLCLSHTHVHCIHNLGDFYPWKTKPTNLMILCCGHLECWFLNLFTIWPSIPTMDLSSMVPPFYCRKLSL